VALVFAYKQFYLGPLEEEIQEQMFVAQQYFERDSFDLALNGDGDYPGFLDIVDDYGSTGAGNLSNLYAGISFFKIGQYEDALDYLLDFSTKDKLLSPIANGCIGDSYVELGEYESAINYYEKAYKDSENSLTTPIFLMKYARVNEELGDWEKSLGSI
jgi:tetratricopeptide (TPR) repeat protein